MYARPIASTSAMPVGSALLGGLERLAQRVERALDQRQVQVVLVLEIDVEQRAAQPRAARDLVHRDRVPARLGIQRFRRVDDFGPTPVLFFLPPFGDVRHADIVASD